MYTQELLHQTKTQQPELLPHVRSVEQRIGDEYEFDYVGNARIDEAHYSKLTRCVGFAIAHSLELESEGIDHRILFLNGHAAVTIPMGEDIWLSEPATPRLGQFLGTNFYRYRNSIEGREVGLVDTRRLAKSAGIDIDCMIVKNPWTTRSSLQTRMKQSYEPGTDHLLIASQLEARVGRAAIYNYLKFNEAFDDTNFEEAGRRLTYLAGAMPEADIRNEFHHKVKITIRHLAVHGNFGLARGATEAIYTDLATINSDSRVHEFHGDGLRYIAKWSGDTVLARAAVELYGKAKDNPRSFKRSLTHKINKCEALIAKGATR